MTCLVTLTSYGVKLSHYSYSWLVKLHSCSRLRLNEETVLLMRVYDASRADQPEESSNKWHTEVMHQQLCSSNNKDSSNGLGIGYRAVSRQWDKNV